MITADWGGSGDDGIFAFTDPLSDPKEPLRYTKLPTD